MMKVTALGAPPSTGHGEKPATSLLLGAQSHGGSALGPVPGGHPGLSHNPLLPVLPGVVTSSFKPWGVAMVTGYSGDKPGTQEGQDSGKKSVARSWVSLGLW